mmetsp:Transcript_748/g.2086  ORF Transcript_748/g.2086 Transcript_748/m.2086 type:complete len:230 (-) Transcript_748:2620-3309(-)
MLAYNKIKKLLVSLETLLLVVPERKVRQPALPCGPCMHTECLLLELADPSQRKDARVESQGCLQSVSLRGPSSSMALTLLGEDLANCARRGGCHLCEDWLPRTVSNGARGVLPHNRVLVGEAPQARLHEGVPMRSAPVSDEFHNVVGNVEGQTAVSVTGIGLQELLYDVHEGSQPHCNELLSVGAHQSTCHVGERHPRRLPRRCPLLHIKVIIVVVVNSWRLALALPPC